MNCKNYKKISNKLGQCSVLNDYGVEFIIEENRASSPCNVCKQEWKNNECPTKENMTNIMSNVLASNGKISLPTITEQAVSIGKSLVEWAFNGFQNVPQHEAERRLNICKSNQCGMYNEDSGRCSACGCFCAAKVQFSHEECPADKWGKKDLGAEVLNNAPPNRCGSCGKK